MNTKPKPASIKTKVRSTDVKDSSVRKGFSTTSRPMKASSKLKA